MIYLYGLMKSAKTSFFSTRLLYLINMTVPKISFSHSLINTEIWIHPLSTQLESDVPAWRIYFISCLGVMGNLSSPRAKASFLTINITCIQTAIAQCVMVPIVRD